MISSSKDTLFNQHKQKAFAKKRKNIETDFEQPTCSKKVNNNTPSCILSTVLRPRSSRSSSNFYIGDESDNEDAEDLSTMSSLFPWKNKSEKSDMNYQPSSKLITGGKSYKRLRKFSISASDCKAADRRLVSIRQQSDLQKSTVGEKKIYASPATVYRKREQCRLEALKKCEEELRLAKAVQLCYDGKIINKMDRYVLLGQYTIEQNKCEKVVAVKTFNKGLSVTAETVFTAIMEHVDVNILNKVSSVLSDTTALNTGKLSRVNKRLSDFYNLHHGRKIHVLECLFHVNEIYLTHIIAKIEGKKKGPGAMEEGALMKFFGDIQKPDMSQMVDRKNLTIPITNMASLHLKKKME